MAEQRTGMSTHGIDLVIFGLIDPLNGQLITGTDQGLTTIGSYGVDTGIEGATTVDYQNLETDGQDQFANNVHKRTTTPTQNPTANLTFLDIAFEIANKLTGYEQGEDGGWSLDQANKPHFAMLTRAQTIGDGAWLYEAFANATGTITANSHNTDNESEQDANVSMSIKAYTPIADVFKLASGRKMPYRKWVSSDKEATEAKILQQVFPGIAANTTVDSILEASKTVATTSTSGD